MANPGLKGEQAVSTVRDNNWDPSVKSLTAFPQILQMMSNRLSWTERLGDAFLAQQDQVMATVQDLRHRAYAAGGLRGNALESVQVEEPYIVIAPASPQLAYVPYYNPNVVYGAWWWPQYPPVSWDPWPGYQERAGYGAGFAWGVGIVLGAEFFFGAFDWRRHHVNVNGNNRFVPRGAYPGGASAGGWQHDPGHRRGVPYPVGPVRSHYSPAGAPAQPRGDYRGRVAAAPVPGNATAAVVARQPIGLGQGMADARRPVNSGTASPQRPHVFENLGQGAQVNDFSARGRASAQAAPSWRPAQRRPQPQTQQQASQPRQQQPQPRAAPAAPPRAQGAAPSRGQGGQRAGGARGQERK